MTLREFLEQNQDILAARVSAEELPSITGGTPLLVLSVGAGIGPVENRAVIAGSFAMAVRNSLSKNPSGCLDLLALTKGGYAKVECVVPADMGRKALFHIHPLPLGDERERLPLLEWGRKER